MGEVLLEKVERAAAIIKAGGVVAFPTETYYGLAVDPFNEAALAKLYRLKQRKASKPLLTLIAHRRDLGLLVSHVPDAFLPLMALWPSPLTLVFPGLLSLPRQLTGGTGTIGVRISSQPLATALIRACGFPLTATSANISGQTACHKPQLVKDQLGDGLDYILDGGATPGGLGSTLVGLDEQRLVVLRDGALPRDVFADLL